MLENRFKLIFLSFIFISSLNAGDIRSLLFHGNCSTCHNEHKSISAPSIDEIKENYLRAFPKRKDFIKYMSELIVKPNKDGSLMLYAIKKYDLMPELGFDKSTLVDISSYIYDTDFSKKHEGHK